MSESTDPDVAWPQILDALNARDLVLAKKLIWPHGMGEDWLYALAPMMEMRAGGYETSDPPLAVFCYEQARNLYRAQAAGATSGGEGLALMNTDRDHEIGRKIWLLKGG